MTTETIKPAEEVKEQTFYVTSLLGEIAKKIIDRQISEAEAKEREKFKFSKFGLIDK